MSFEIERPGKSIVPIVEIPHTVVQYVDDRHLPSQIRHPNLAQERYWRLCNRDYEDPSMPETYEEGDMFLGVVLEVERQGLVEEVLDVSALILDKTKRYRRNRHSGVIDRVSRFTSIAYMRSVVLLDECLTLSDLIERAKNQDPDEEVRAEKTSYRRKVLTPDFESSIRKNPELVAKCHAHYKSVNPALYDMLKFHSRFISGGIAQFLHRNYDPNVTSTPQLGDQARIVHIINPALNRAAFFMLRAAEVTYYPDAV